MRRPGRPHHALTFCTLTAVGCLLLLASQKAARSGWRHYRNARWGFCVDYPPGWTSFEGTDLSGVRLVPSGSPPGRALQSFEIGGLPDQPADVENPSAWPSRAAPMTLKQNFEYSLVAKREFERLEGISVLEERPLKFEAYHALETTIRYRRPSWGERTERTLWISWNHVIFTVSAKWPANESSKLDPLYEEIAFRRLKLDCPSKQ